ncbi:MAG: hypothetical protein JO144_07450 [Actinobacteria bacterium]|nr:hypothetical protein [Actinomycetota bacterium]
MGRDDSIFDVHWLDEDSGDATAPNPPRLPWPRWFTVAVVVLALAAAAGVINRVRTDSPSAPAAAPSTPATSRPAPSTSPPASSAVPPGPVTVTPLGRPLLGATTGWELIGRGVGVLVRIQPAAGRIVRTTLPDLRSSGAVSLLSGSDRVIIRPMDDVPGYLVRDGQAAREMPLALNLDGPVFPGPVAGQMWVRPADDHQPVMALATLDGKRLADFVPVPPGSSPFEAVADGAGYLLYSGIGGVYQARPGGLRRISTGALLAVGPTGWLVAECDERYRCSLVLVDRRSGTRRTLPGGAVSRDSTGVLSPDGTTAAMLTAGSNGSAGLYLLDLATGRRRTIDLSVGLESIDGTLAFSPDSRWLFAISADGTLMTVNRATGAVRELAHDLPPLSQLVVRPAGAGS